MQTDSGYHVILLEETRKQEPPAVEEIRKELATAAGRKRLDDYIQSLRGRLPLRSSHSPHSSDIK